MHNDDDDDDTALAGGADSVLRRCARRSARADVAQLVLSEYFTARFRCTDVRFSSETKQRDGRGRQVVLAAL